jgi:hypothetical protein
MFIINKIGNYILVIIIDYLNIKIMNRIYGIIKLVIHLVSDNSIS